MADDARHSQLSTDTAAVDVQATFCATLVDQWIVLGVRHAVISPGSRSTPMALAIAARPELDVHIVHDERVAAFTALGLGLPVAAASGAPALLLCTSGTAAANYLPAVAEAGVSEVPMIVLTADRPPELQGVGAPQTIDQVELYGSHVKWFRDAGVPTVDGAATWRQLAASAWFQCERGPAHLNLAFREPLVGRPCELPESAESTSDVAAVSDSDPVPSGVESSRGVILVGGVHGQNPERILDLHACTGWPLIADPQSGLRHSTSVAFVDSLLRIDEFAQLPEVIVRIGRPSTSKVLAQWSAHPDPLLVQVGGPGRIDPAHNVAAVCALDDLIEAVDGVVTPDADWRDSWVGADAIADDVITGQLSADDALTEPMVARILADHVPADSLVTVSSSMPIRDLEWFGGRNAVAHANRGANGIDGVMSTAIGRALAIGSTAPSFVLIGDLAFVHDSNALVALNRRDADLRVIVVDNGGGGIFSFLPQEQLLDHDRFEQLFGTPLGTDVLALAAAHGLVTSEVSTPDALVEQLQQPGPWVCRVPSDRALNVEVHRRINGAIANALDS